MRLLFLLFTTSLVLSCKTTDSEAPSGAPSALAANASASAAAAPASGDSLKVGPVTSDDLKQVIYKALDRQISKKQELGGGDETKTEIGDLDSFKFSVTRLGKGQSEVTGNDSPDAADVDITGWYRVTVTGNGQQDLEPACSSFDASLSLIKVGEDWRVPEGQEAIIEREDSEDCF